MTRKSEASDMTRALEKALWETADRLRNEWYGSQMPYYYVPLLLLRYLSDKSLGDKARSGLEIPPEAEWSSLSKSKGQLGKRIDRALRALETSNPQLDGVFSFLGFDSLSRRARSGLSEVVDRLGALEFGGALSFPTVLDSLLDTMADSLGYRGGEFRTPRGLPELLVRFLTPEPGMTVCDPSCGSGGLLVAAAESVVRGNPSAKGVFLYGQEKSVANRSLCVINILLHGIQHPRIELGDTLRTPLLLDDTGKLLKFDRVLSSPPMSLRDWGQEYAQKDPFNRYRFGIPPKAYGDFAFVQHSIAALSDIGKAVLVTAPGPLFRGGSEQVIRKNLVEGDFVEAVIALAPKLLYGTAIPPHILVLNKAKPVSRRKKVLFVDGTQRGVRLRLRTLLRRTDIDWLERAYRSFRSSDGVTAVVDAEVIAKNDFLLGPTRYIEGVRTGVVAKPSEISTEGRRFEQWIDNLPFPLGSILWSYASTLNDEQRTRTLLHFFEAMSQFNVTIMLSALTGDREFYDTHFSSAIDKDFLTRASFGGWVLIGTRLASTIRKVMRNSLTREGCISAFGGVDEDFVSLVSDSETLGILDKAAELRNLWVGHSGAVTKAEFSERLATLNKMLEQIRRIVRDRYSSVILVLPGIVERVQDGVLYNIVREIRGTRTPFREIRVETIVPMESDSLYFLAGGGSRPIRLLRSCE